MDAFTFEQLQTSFQQAIDFVKTGKALSITQDGQAAALASCSAIRWLLSCTVKECPTECVKAVYGRHE